jgi:hypothetical protein
MGQAKRRKEQRQAAMDEAMAIARDQFSCMKENHGADYSQEDVEKHALFLLECWGLR